MWLHCTRFTLFTSARSMSKCAMRLAFFANFAGTPATRSSKREPTRDEEVAVVHSVVRERRAVHAEHAHAERTRRVVRADAHQRGDDRECRTTPTAQ